MNESLWGTLPTGEGIQTPSSILNEQIVELQKATSGLLTGRLQTTQGNSGDLVIYFFIVAPTLNQYTVRLMTVTHGIQLYPCMVSSPYSPGATRASDEDSFRASVGRILQDPKTHNIVAGLLAQIRSEKDTSS